MAEKATLIPEFSRVLALPPFPKGQYRHYKTGDTYTIVCKSLNSNTCKPMVTYTCNKTRINFTKSIEEFMELTDEGRRKYEMIG